MYCSTNCWPPRESKIAMPLKVSLIKALQTLTPKCSDLTPQLITLPIVTVAVLSALVLTTAALPAQAAPQSKSQTSATKIIQATTAPIKSADGFDLYQTSTIKGDFNVFVSSQGIKIFDRKNITGIVAKPPLWDVYTYNNVTRRVCKQTFKAYKGMGHDADDTTGGANMLALPLAKGKPTDLLGIAAKKHSSKTWSANPPIRDFLNGLSFCMQIKHWYQLEQPQYFVAFIVCQIKAASHCNLNISVCAMSYTHCLSPAHSNLWKHCKTVLIRLMTATKQ